MRATDNLKHSFHINVTSIKKRKGARGAGQGATGNREGEKLITGKSNREGEKVRKEKGRGKGEGRKDEGETSWRHLLSPFSGCSRPK